MSKVVETLVNLRKNFYGSTKDVNAYLVSIEHSLAEAIWFRDYILIDNIQVMLQDVASGKKPPDPASYNLGKAQSICEVISYFNVHKNNEMLSKDICSTQQFEVLKYIADSREVIPTQIVARFGMPKQQVSNILRQLLLKELVHMLPVGRNHWYSLSVIGQKVLLQAMNMEKNRQFVRRFLAYLLKNYEWSAGPIKEKRYEDSDESFIFIFCASYEKTKTRSALNEKGFFVEDIKFKTKIAAKGNNYAGYGEYRREFFRNRGLVSESWN